MKSLKTKALVAVTAVSLAAAGVGVTSAATNNNNSVSQNPKNRVARYTMQDERVQAVAKVLNTTPSDLENKLKTETMQQVIKDAGLTDSSFRDKVKAQVQSDLLAQGYTQTQIDNTMDHHHGIGHRMRPDTDHDGN